MRFNLEGGGIQQNKERETHALSINDEYEF